MEIFLVILLIAIGVAWFLCGLAIASCDMYNGHVPTPDEFYSNGYNRIGSWVAFIFRIIIGLPFYIVFTMVECASKFFKWLFTVGR